MSKGLAASQRKEVERGDSDEDNSKLKKKDLRVRSKVETLSCNHLMRLRLRDHVNV